MGFATYALRQHKSFVFTEIVSVTAEKVDKITYEELFLTVHTITGDGVAVGELDEGFAELEKALSAHLKEFPDRWKADAEERPAGARNEIWRRGDPLRDSECTHCRH